MTSGVTWLRPASSGPFPAPARSDRSAPTPDPQSPASRTQDPADPQAKPAGGSRSPRQARNAAQALGHAHEAGGPPLLAPPLLAPSLALRPPRASSRGSPRLSPATVLSAPSQASPPPAPSVARLPGPFRTPLCPSVRPHTLSLPVPLPPPRTPHLWVTLHTPLSLCLPRPRPLCLSRQADLGRREIWAPAWLAECCVDLGKALTLSGLSLQSVLGRNCFHLETCLTQDILLRVEFSAVT